jgi:DNA-binding NtrC family response regulator
VSRVLIVDDDAELLQVLDETIGGLGYHVRLAATAAEALRLAEFEPPDAISLDISRPDAGGTSTLNWLRQRHPTIPVIMLTGNTDEALARETLKRGAFDYIKKPFDVPRLREVLETALACGPRQEPT